MTRTAAAVARLTGGRRVGRDREFSGVAPAEHAKNTDLAYVERGDGGGCGAGILLVREAVAGRCCVVVDDPKLAFITVLGALFPELHPSGVQPGAFVHPSARLGEGVHIYPGAWVGPDCQVGAGSVIFPGAVLYPGTVLGEGCRIHAGAVLGADGFSYHPTPRGPVKVPQVGRVRLGDRVEVGANTCVDRAFLEETVVGDDSKLDNLVQVGHNSRLGRGVLLAGQVGLSGSVELGDGVVMGGQAGVADHARVETGARIGAQSGVHGRLGSGAWLGTPAIPVRVALRAAAALKELPGVLRRLRAIERRLRALEGRGGDDTGPR